MPHRTPSTRRLVPEPNVLSAPCQLHHQPFSRSGNASQGADHPSGEACDDHVRIAPNAASADRSQCAAGIECGSADAQRELRDHPYEELQLDTQRRRTKGTRAEQSARPRPARACALWRAEKKSVFRNDTEPEAVAVTNGVRPSPAAVVSATALRHSHWPHSRRALGIVARGIARRARVREVQPLRTWRLARDETQTVRYARKPRRGPPQIVQRLAHGPASTTPRAPTYQDRLGIAVLLIPQRRRLLVCDRLLLENLHFRRSAPTRQRTAETTAQVVLVEQVSRAWVTGHPRWKSARACSPESSERAVRPLRNQSISPVLGGVPCADSTPGLGGQAQWIRVRPWNRLSSIRAADGYRP